MDRDDEELPGTPAPLTLSNKTSGRQGCRATQHKGKTDIELIRSTKKIVSRSPSQSGASELLVLVPLPVHAPH